MNTSNDSKNVYLVASSLPLIERRMLEAEVFVRVYDALTASHGQEVALSTVIAAVEASAEKAGRAFAQSAPGGPSLKHFMRVLDLWRSGDALELGEPAALDSSFSFEVRRCGYVEAYRAMGAPAPLIGQLSCRRDAAFARAYSPLLSMERPECIGRGDERCFFRFTWNAPDSGPGPDGPE